MDSYNIYKMDKGLNIKKQSKFKFSDNQKKNNLNFYVVVVLF